MRGAGLSHAVFGNSEKAMDRRKQRLVYLITYSRADETKIASREAFAEAVCDAFRNLDVARVMHWVVSREFHNDSEEAAFPTHYHMALKLDKRARWLRVRQLLQDRYDIRVNFSDVHNTYHSAYMYVTKEDESFVLSDDHPDMSTPPTTEKAIAGKKRKKGKKKKKNDEECEHLSTFDVVQLIREKNINNRLELICHAENDRRTGKPALAEFIANRGVKVVDEALSLAKEFDEAPAKLARAKLSRIQLLNAAYHSNCVEGCNGKWLECALTILRDNNISLRQYCSVIYKALEFGRGKYRNVYIYGPANTGKTFMLSPLKKVFNTFSNPATGTFAWVGVQNAEVVLLNDLRWHPSMIAWGDFLQLLEGDTVHLPAPKTFSNSDIEFEKDTPFFATADAPLVLIKGGSLDSSNTEMMNVRWAFFHFSRRIPQEQQISLEPCGHCFSRLITDYKDF